MGNLPERLAQNGHRDLWSKNMVERVAPCTRIDILVIFISRIARLQGRMGAFTGRCVLGCHSGAWAWQ